MDEEKKKRLKDEIMALVVAGAEIHNSELSKTTTDSTKKLRSTKKAEVEKQRPLQFEYQFWYTKALPVVRQLLPDRYQEFKDQYRLEKRNDKDITYLNYTISDYLIGLQVTRGYPKVEVFSSLQSFSTKFTCQLGILESAKNRLDSILADIAGVLQSDLFRHELEAADELLKKNHLRAAGALAGVSLETHLRSICANHGLRIRKKAPAISDFNDALKESDIFDVPTWRNVQLLGDIRNLCVHAKERDPTKDEVTTLLSGTRKILANTI